MKTLSILYVEDNKELRETLSDMLEGPGRAVVAVATGEAALAAWQSGGFKAALISSSSASSCSSSNGLGNARTFGPSVAR